MKSTGSDKKAVAALIRRSHAQEAAGAFATIAEGVRVFSYVFIDDFEVYSSDDEADEADFVQRLVAMDLSTFLFCDLRVDATLISAVRRSLLYGKVVSVRFRANTRSSAFWRTRQNGCIMATVVEEPQTEPRDLCCKRFCCPKRSGRRGNDIQARSTRGRSSLL